MPCSPFRILWDREDIFDIAKTLSGGKVQYEDGSVRFLEAESAFEAKLLPLENWYKLPKIEREYIIATRLARLTIDGVTNKYIHDRARRK